MFKFCTILVSLGLFLGLAQPVTAIEFHANENLSIKGEETLNNAYLAGNQVSVNVPVTNDLVVAGNEVEVESDIEGGLIAAASRLQVNGPVGRNVRVAGGEVAINNTVGQDVMVFGADVIIGSDAKIAGDVFFAGGKLIVNGDVEGTLIVNCRCDVTVNGSVAAIKADLVEALRLGREARVAGKIEYTSAREADINRDAVVGGDINHTAISKAEASAGQFNSAAFFYGMISSLVLALILLLIFRRVPEVGIASLRQNVLLTFGLGIAVLVLTPIVAFASMIVSVWLGLSLLVLYVLLLLLSFNLAQIIIGWWLMQWWLGRTKQSYELDWRAVVVGVLTTTIFTMVQVLGWFIIFLAILLALGGLAQGLWRLRQPLGE